MLGGDMTRKIVRILQAAATARGILIRRGFAVAAILFAVAAPDMAYAAGPDASGISYSADQAQQGKAVFGRRCVSCHGDDMTGGVGGGPPLTGDYFFGLWGEQPLSAVYSFIKSAMPEDNPGSLSNTQVTQVLAYILQFNGFPAGDAEMAVGAEQVQGTLPAAQP
jgi:S-disulfanyl-L-cysteine oxidoreductase SoxD